MSLTTLFHCSDLHFGHPAVPEQYEAIEALIQERKYDVVAISGDVSDDTTVKWTPARDASANRIWWRETAEPQWSHARQVPPSGQAVLKDVVIDDWFFGVSAVSADGYESPVVFPGPAGSWAAPESAARP